MIAIASPVASAHPAKTYYVKAKKRIVAVLAAPLIIWLSLIIANGICGSDKINMLPQPYTNSNIPCSYSRGKLTKIQIYMKQIDKKQINKRKHVGSGSLVKISTIVLVKICESTIYNLA